MAKRLPTILKAARRPAPKGRIRVASSQYSYAPSDAFRQKRAPTPVELTQGFRNATYVCARLNAISVASQPLRLYATTGGKAKAAPRCRTKAISRNRERALSENPGVAKRLAGVDRVDEVTEHPILDLIDEVNPWLDRFQLLYMTQVYQEVVGTAFWYFVSGVGGRPIEIWPLPSWMVQVVPDFTGTDVISHYTFTGGGGQSVLAVEDVLYLRHLSLLDPYTGSWSPLRAGYDYAQVQDKQIAYRDSTLTNRGRPDAMLIPREEGGESAVDPIAIQRITAEYEQSFGLGRAGRLWVPPGGMELKPIGWSPTDLGEIEMSRATLHDVARVMGVPIPLVDGDSTNRANLDAALLQHARYGVRPRCRELEETLNSNFVTRWDDSGRLFFAFDDPVPSDAVLERENAKTYVHLIKTVNEVRAEQGLPPVDDGDALYRPSSLTELGVEPAAPAAGGVPRKPGSPDPDEDGNDEPFDEGDDVAAEAEGKAWEGEHRGPFGGGRTKFNRNHGSDGRFASGSGGGRMGFGDPATYGTHRVDFDLADVKGRVEGIGPNNHFGSGPPMDAKDAAAAKAAEAKGKTAVRVTERPRMEIRTEGDETRYMVGGYRSADVLKSESGWVAREYGVGNHPDEHRDHSYKKRSVADEKALRVAQRHRDAGTESRYFAVKDVRRFDYDEHAITVPHWDAHFYVIRPGGSKSFAVFKDVPDRGIPEWGPGDRDEHEDNTWGLPEGTPIRREVRRWFRKIAREYEAYLAANAARLLGTSAVIGAPVPQDWPQIAHYANPMATAMTPLLSAYWDEAGKGTRARLGLDPDEWRVVDPHLHEKIASQAHDFCAETLRTTDLDVVTAYRELKRELSEGLGFDGEPVRELTKRVKAVFQDAETWRAERIARTEASRAVNAASLQSAKESGVVAAKRWLLSSNACEKCHEVADRVNAQGGIPLDEPFATGLSQRPAYADAPTAPLHPGCRCSHTFVLTPEYQAIVDANPPATFGPGPMGPEA